MMVLLDYSIEVNDISKSSMTLLIAVHRKPTILTVLVTRTLIVRWREERSNFLGIILIKKII